MKVTSATSEEFELAVKARLKTSWPFRHMAIGEVVVIVHEHFNAAQIQRKAHKHASVSGKKFTCKSSEKGVYVKRIA